MLFQVERHCLLRRGLMRAEARVLIEGSRASAPPETRQPAKEGLMELRARREIAGPRQLATLPPGDGGLHPKHTEKKRPNVQLFQYSD